MLTIRDAQMQIFEGLRGGSPREVMRRHVRAQFSRELAEIDEARLERFLDRVTAEAGRYGLHRLEALLRFVNLSVVYGEGFLARPELRWMTVMLQGPARADADERMKRVYEEALRRAEGGH